MYELRAGRPRRPAKSVLGEAGADQRRQSFQRRVLILPVRIQRNGHALGDSQRKNAEQTLCIDLPVILLNPDGRLVAILLLIKKGCGP